MNPDNYDIDDMRSDDSTDDDSRPKKTIPSWARSKKPFRDVSLCGVI